MNGYPSVGPDDDLTAELDHWAQTHTGAIVIDLPNSSEQSRTGQH